MESMRKLSRLGDESSAPSSSTSTTSTTTTTTTTTTTATTTTTTPPVCGIENNVNYPGNDVNWGPNWKQPDAESCRNLCEQSNFNPKPSYFTWIGSSENHTPDAQKACWCKTALDQEGRIDQVDVFSGPIMCTTIPPTATSTDIITTSLPTSAAPTTTEATPICKDLHRKCRKRCKKGKRCNKKIWCRNNCYKTCRRC